MPRHSRAGRRRSAKGLSLKALDPLYRLFPDRARPQLKSLVGLLLFRTRLYRLLWRDKALIILFHRVDDSLENDSLTCSERQFAAYCDFLGRYFDVISLTALLDRLAAGQDITRCVAITFDDGYKDNRTAAGRILKARGLPASFFVTSGFVGSTVVPWWDAERSITPTWMTWDDLEWLTDNGFEIGAHTESHPDLGQLDRDAARQEIVGGGAALEERLQHRVSLFSYPYGRAENIREESRELVQAAGYRCCLAAIGGVVSPGSDPYRLDRYAVSSRFHSAYHMGFDVSATCVGIAGGNGT